MNLKQAHSLTGPDQWFRYWLPYQFVKIDGPRKHTYLPVNRNYKPLGVVSKEWADYHKFHDQAVVFAKNPAEFKGIWYNEDGLYLYSDDPKTRLDYFERLQKLLSYSAALVCRVGATTL
ncbi:hypothetical protein [Afipia sp. Root123D2]|uniref:hypothetical protein n=1 Tax=Afipia sp. Root123D2 TaxID=1736436 RepID=UPI000A43FB20|nr:hypothetical protein [Afipia sp. Root123D2]